jgi:CheY-like chemotaxis protein
LGEGTSAEIWLPRSAAGEELPARPPEQVSSPLQPTRPLHVLLVDDHAEVRTMTAGMLQDLGHSVTEVASGSEALRCLHHAASRPDLIISDYAMPNLNGLELVHRVREAAPDMPALLVTGYADADAIGARPGDLVILLKPFGLADLSAAIGQAAAADPA